MTVKILWTCDCCGKKETVDSYLADRPKCWSPFNRLGYDDLCAHCIEIIEQVLHDIKKLHQ